MKRFQYRKSHLEKLVSIIKKDYKIKIKKMKTDCLSSKSHPWMIGHQEISIGFKDDNFLVIGSIAHEFGHCLSVLKKQNIPFDIYWMYKFHYLKDDNHAKQILKEERNAWRLGFKFLKDMGIPVDDRLLNMRKVLIETHIKNIKHIQNKIK